MSVRMRRIVEREISTAIVNALVAQGFKITVDYGDGESAVFSNALTILKTMFQGDEDRLYVYDKKQTLAIGWVYLVYGNDGWDVLSDYTTNLEKFIGDGTAVQKIVDKYSDY
jgi:hypothetical protein